MALLGVSPRAVEGGRNRWARAKEENPDLYAKTKAAQPNLRFQTPEEVAAVCVKVVKASVIEYGAKVIPVT